MAAPHTPLPWAVDPDRPASVMMTDRQQTTWNVADCTEFAPQDVNGIGNAAFIVCACNAHYQMLEALKAVVRVADRNTVEFDMARVAIAAAKAEAR